MEHVTFEEYQAAKAEIIGGVQYEERSALDGDVIHKTYTTERGTFYERNEGGRVEFWSDTHPESRIYDENELSAPVIKCKKTPGKKCRNMTERREKR